MRNFYLVYGVPVENIIICEALTVKEILDELAKISVVWFLLKSQGSTIVKICCKLRYKGKQTVGFFFHFAFLAFDLFVFFPFFSVSENFFFFF